MELFGDFRISNLTDKDGTTKNFRYPDPISEESFPVELSEVYKLNHNLHLTQRGNLEIS